MPLCLKKWRPLKVFAKLHKSPLWIANTVKEAVSGLRQFLTTENFLFNLIKLNLLLANQSLLTLCIFIKPMSDIREVWKHGPLKLGSHWAINPDSIAKFGINQKLSPKLVYVILLYVKLLYCYMLNCYMFILVWRLRRQKIVAHFRSLEIIANFQDERKLLYYEIKMKKSQISVANFWRWFEINKTEWDNCNTFEKTLLHE